MEQIAKDDLVLYYLFLGPSNMVIDIMSHVSLLSYPAGAREASIGFTSGARRREQQTNFEHTTPM